MPVQLRRPFGSAAPSESFGFLREEKSSPKKKNLQKGFAFKKV